MLFKTPRNPLEQHIIILTERLKVYFPLWREHIGHSEVSQNQTTTGLLHNITTCLESTEILAGRNYTYESNAQWNVTSPNNMTDKTSNYALLLMARISYVCKNVYPLNIWNICYLLLPAIWIIAQLKMCFIGNEYIYLTDNYSFTLDLIYTINPFFLPFVHLLTSPFLRCWNLQGQAISPEQFKHPQIHTNTTNHWKYLYHAEDMKAGGNIGSALLERKFWKVS